MTKEERFELFVLVYNAECDLRREGSKSPVGSEFADALGRVSALYQVLGLFELTAQYNYWKEA